MTYYSRVGGKIIETTVGDYNIYAKKDIVTTSATTVTETGVKKGVLYAKNPKSPTNKKFDRCIIHFRPNRKSWDGTQFGFDWNRRGQFSDLEVNTDYIGTIGKYDSNGIFKASQTLYEKHRDMYEYTDYEVQGYFTPYMTLMPGFIANLDVFSDVEETPDKLEYVFDEKIFDLTISNILKNKKIGINLSKNGLIVKCLQQFSVTKYIQIVAHYGSNSHRVGIIKVIPNDAVKKIDVVFIPVEFTKLGKGTGIPGEGYITAGTLRQAYIDVNMTEMRTPLKMTNKWFDYLYTSNGAPGTIKTRTYLGGSLFEAFDIAYFEKYPNASRNSYRVYTLPFNNTLNGEAENIGKNGNVIVFQQRAQETVVHELLHSIGLYHTFDNNGLYTYEKFQTDNIMDYTHHINKKRISLNRWQWKQMNPLMG
jgi:hypothetical protein